MWGIDDVKDIESSDETNYQIELWKNNDGHGIITDMKTNINKSLASHTKERASRVIDDISLVVGKFKDYIITL